MSQGSGDGKRGVLQIFRRAAIKAKNFRMFTRRSSFEGFFASKGAAYALPDGDFARQASTTHGGELQLHLQAMVNLLRDEDVLRLVVKLESMLPNKIRYVTIVSAFGPNDEEESIVIGVDWNTTLAFATIGLVVPLYRDAVIKMDGDGGFKLTSAGKSNNLKPVSVQTMWTALQWIHKCQANASRFNYYCGGMSHSWVAFYNEKITSDRESLAEWHWMEDVWSRQPVIPIGVSKEEELVMKLISLKLKEVMMKVDLEEVTCRQLREKVEEETQIDLKEWKSFFNDEMLVILGQMDSPTQVFDYLYLGSEWNASNLEELKENGVGYVLNITREIDNFFPGTFTYYNIRVYDEEETDLLPYWGKTFKFIKKAKDSGSKCLVHCKMGVSRSASSVIAFAMKEYGWSLSAAMKFVKAKRSCIQPNAAFWKQLITYEGILNSSKQRYNELFTRQRANSDSGELREKARRRREARKKKKNERHTLDWKCKPAYDEVEEEMAKEEGADTTEGEALVDRDHVSLSGSDEESNDSESAGDDDDNDAFLSVDSTDNEALSEAVADSSTPSLLHEDSSSAQDLTHDVSCDDTLELQEPSAPVDKQETSDVTETSLHRVKSVPTLTDTSVKRRVTDSDPNSVQRSSSLRECGRKRLSDTNLWKCIRSSSAEHLNEFDGKASLWDAIEKSEQEFSAREQVKILQEKSPEDTEQAAIDQVVQLEFDEQEQQEEMEKMETPEVEVEKTDGVEKMNQKATETSSEVNAVVLRRPRPYIGVPAEVLKVAESGLVKRHSRNFEDCPSGVKVDSGDDVLTLRVDKENCEEVMQTTAEPCEDENLNAEADVAASEDEKLETIELEKARKVDHEEGLVRKQTQEFEQLHREVVQTKPATPEAGTLEAQVEDYQVHQDAQGSNLDTETLCATESDGRVTGSMERMEEKCELFVEPRKTSLLLDVEAVAPLQKMDEDAKKVESIQKSTANLGHESLVPENGEGGDMREFHTGETLAVQENEEGQGTKVEKSDINNTSDEVPKPGLVKRNTLLLEEKTRGLLALDVARAKAPAEDRPTQTEDRPTRAEDRPTRAEDRATRAEDRPTRAEDRPTRAEDRPTQTEGDPVQESTEGQCVKDETIDRSITSDEIPKPGLVKRNTLLLEEKTRELLALEVERATKSPAEDRPVHDSEEGQCVKDETIDISDEVPKPGMVKRNTLLLEEKTRELLALEVERATKSPAEDRPTQTEGDPTSTELVSDASVAPSDGICESETDRAESCGVKRDRSVSQGDEQNTGWLQQNAGLVKRHKLVIEERLHTRDTEADKTRIAANEEHVDGEEEDVVYSNPSEKEVLNLSSSELESVSDANLKEVPNEIPRRDIEDTTNVGVRQEAISSVQRQNPYIEETVQCKHEASGEFRARDGHTNTQQQTEDTSINEGVPAQPLETIDLEHLCSNHQLESGEDELVVDISSVVHVRTHTQLLEERLREASAQLPANGDERRRDSNEDERQDESETLSGAAVLTSSEDLQSRKCDESSVVAEDAAVVEAEIGIGNVRRKAQLLERLIHDVMKAAEVFKEFKDSPVSPRRPVLRRNESLKVGRSMDSGLGRRRRSLSDVCRTWSDEGPEHQANP